MTRWTEVARAQAGSRYGRTYADRFAAIAAEGGDVHGEGRFVLDLRPAPATVLDAGCGTGRVAAYLVGEGYDVVGVDVDEEMLRVAREDLPDLDWRLADLATLDLGRTFDVVLLAGNIIPLLEAASPDSLHDQVTEMLKRAKAGNLALLQQMGSLPAKDPEPFKPYALWLLLVTDDMFGGGASAWQVAG